MHMKKMLILALIALFYIGASVLTQPQNVVVDDDVGICYALPTDQASDMVMYVADNSILSMPDYRSLYSGVEKPEIIVYNDSENFQCNTYYTIDRIDLKLPTLPGFDNQIDKYPLASDLGLRES